MARTKKSWFVVTNNKETKLSENFKAKEFACEYEDVILVSVELVSLLQVIRNNIKGPLIITSGYRNKAKNTQVGGAKESYHLFGMAADIKSTVATPREIAMLADACMEDFGGVILHNTYVHVDVRDKKYREGF